MVHLLKGILERKYFTARAIVSSSGSVLLINSMSDKGNIKNLLLISIKPRDANVFKLSGNEYWTTYA